jgi:hypothetical protein
MPPTKLTAEILTAAIEGFEVQKKRIEDQIAELRSVLDGGRTEQSTRTEDTQRPRRKVSAAARRKMAEAQKKRWAAVKQNPEPQSVTPDGPKPKRKLSAAGRKRIIEATKKRWAAVKAAKEAVKPAVVKKASVKRASTNEVGSKKRLLYLA